MHVNERFWKRLSCLVSFRHKPLRSGQPQDYIIEMATQKFRKLKLEYRYVRKDQRHHEMKEMKFTGRNRLWKRKQLGQLDPSDHAGGATNLLRIQGISPYN